MEFKKPALRFPDFKFPDLELQERTFPLPSLLENEDFLEEIDRSQKEKEEYDAAVLAALQGIERNTAGIADLVFLISNSNEKQDEVFELLVEVLALAKAKNAEEGKSLYKKIFGKLSDFTGDVETVQKLIGLANAIYAALNFGSAAAGS